MMIRIVKMKFQPGKENDFLRIYSENEKKIRSSIGCTHLELLRDTTDPTLFFTYSHWETEEDLHAYRNSILFLSVWEKVTLIFSEKAEAWTTEMTAV